MASSAPCPTGLFAALERAGHALANRQNVYAGMLRVGNGDEPAAYAFVCDENADDPAAPTACSPLPLFDSDSESWPGACIPHPECIFWPSATTHDTLHGFGPPLAALPSVAQHTLHDCGVSLAPPLSVGQHTLHGFGLPLAALPSVAQHTLHDCGVSLVPLPRVAQHALHECEVSLAQPPSFGQYTLHECGFSLPPPPSVAQDTLHGRGVSLARPPSVAQYTLHGFGLPLPLPPSFAQETLHDAQHGVEKLTPPNDDIDPRAALRERLLERTRLAQQDVLYEYFCEGRFFPCLIVNPTAVGSGAKNTICVYMGNKGYIVEIKASERRELVRSAYSCAVTRRNESLRDVARRTNSTQSTMLRLNRHIAGIASSSRFQPGVILRTGRS